MTDRILPEAEARAYLNARYAEITKAVVADDLDAATAVVARMRADGFPSAADEAFDGIIAVRDLRVAAEQLDQLVDIRDMVAADRTD